MSEHDDALAISQLIANERRWRNLGQWDKMCDAYHPDSIVRVAWFHGSGPRRGL